MRPAVAATHPHLQHLSTEKEGGRGAKGTKMTQATPEWKNSLPWRSCCDHRPIMTASSQRTRCTATWMRLAVAAAGIIAASSPSQPTTCRSSKLHKSNDLIMTRAGRHDICFYTTVQSSDLIISRPCSVASGHWPVQTLPATNL